MLSELKPPVRKIAMGKFYKPSMNEGFANRQRMLAFGAYVRGLRLDRDMTQNQVAALVGVTDNHISDIENGVRKLSPERYEQFAAAFGLDKAEFGKMLLQHYDPHTYGLIFGKA